MIDGTRREIVEVLLNADASATDIADELDLSVQTVHRHLEALREDGYVHESGKRDGKTRPYKLYSVNDVAVVFSIFGGKAVERSIELTDAHEMIFSILEVPQSEFHFPLLSYLLSITDLASGVAAVAVYGSVARGDATDESDVDVLFVTDDEDAKLPAGSMLVPGSYEIDHGSKPSLDRNRVVTTESFTRSELREGLELDSQFLRNAVRESIALYDPDGILRRARDEYVEETGASSGVSR